jgi:hypothetical protein
MVKLMNLKIVDFPSRHAFLVSFHDVANRYDQLADVPLAASFKRTLLQASIMHDTALLNSWNKVNEVRRAVNPSAPPTSYSEFYTFLVTQAKTHDIAIPFKRSTRHAHRANFDSFSDGTDDIDNDDDSVLDDVIAHMSIQNEPMNEDVVNALQVYSTFQRRRNNNGPARKRDPEAEIPHPLYSEVFRELKSAWSHEDTNIKKRILQCKQQAPKQQDPKQGAKKNAELGVYMIEAEGYASESDASAWSEATYGYDNDDASVDNVEPAEEEVTDLVVNAAASRQRRPRTPTGGILPSADPRRFLANKATPVRSKEGKIVGHFTYGANMAKLMNVAKALYRLDQIPSSVPIPNEGIYYASAAARKFFSELLTLMDGGANGGIGGRDMKLMSYNTDGRRVNIGIAGDHQMTGKKLGTFCAVINTQLGRVLGIFHQYAHVPEQARSIHSRCQFQAYGNLVGDTATIYGGPQRIDTSDSYHLPRSLYGQDFLTSVKHIQPQMT